MNLLNKLRQMTRFLKNLDIESVGRSTFQHCTSPKALYVTLVERWWLIAACALVGIVVGCVVIKTTTRQFESSGRILVYQKLPTFLDESTKLPDPKAYASLFATHVQLIGSPMIIDRAINDCNLKTKCPAIQDELEDEETTADYIRNQISVTRAGAGDSEGAFVIRIIFRHTDRNECQLVVNAVLETYSNYLDRSMLEDQSKAVSLIDTMIASIETDVQRKGVEYRSFLSAAPGVWDRETMNNPHQGRVTAFEVELTELEIKQAALQSRIRIMEQSRSLDRSPESDLARLALIDDSHVQRLEMLISVKADKIVDMYQTAYPELQEVASSTYDGLLQLQLERDELTRNVGPNHPRVKDIDSKISLLQEKLNEAKSGMTLAQDDGLSVSPADLVNAYERLLTEELADTTTRIEFVQQSIVKEIDLAKSLIDFSVRASQLESEYLREVSKYDALVTKAQKQSLLNQFGSYVAEIIHYPKKGHIVWPKKPVIIALCTIIGIFAGSFLALALDLIALTPLRTGFSFLPAWLLGKGPAQMPAS